MDLEILSASERSVMPDTIRHPSMDLPAWLAVEIEHLAQFQANSKASVVRQLLVEAIEHRNHRLV